MPKLIGLITGFYVEGWIEPAIQQALAYCDEVIVSIGAHAKNLEVLQDNTMERAEKYSEQITLVPSVTKNVIVGPRGLTLNKMVEASGAQVGDWLWMLDADEFYFDTTAQKIREVVNSDNDFAMFDIAAKFFFLNMTRYLLSRHTRLYKLTHEGVHFSRAGSQSWTGKGNRGSIGRDPEEEQFGMFHYSLCMSPRYRRLMWSNEYTQTKSQIKEEQDRKVNWLDNIFMNFELDREDYWIDKNVELLGLKKRTPIWTHDFHPQPDGTLFRYDGRHPPVIEQAGLHLIDDFRTFYND